MGLTPSHPLGAATGPAALCTAVALALTLTLALASGCTTQFYGEPMFPGGARGCWDKCHGEGLEMSAFVYMGEYSSGCVCRVRTTGDVAPAESPEPAAPPLAPSTTDVAPPGDEAATDVPAPPAVSAVAVSTAPTADVQATAVAGAAAAVAVTMEQQPFGAR